MRVCIHFSTLRTSGSDPTSEALMPASMSSSSAGSHDLKSASCFPMLYLCSEARHLVCLCDDRKGAALGALGAAIGKALDWDCSRQCIAAHVEVVSDALAHPIA